MSREQMVGVAVAVVIVLIVIFGWYAYRKSGEAATSLPPQPAPSLQAPQPQQP